LFYLIDGAELILYFLMTLFFQHFLKRFSCLRFQNVEWNNLKQQEAICTKDLAHPKTVFLSAAGIFS